MNGMSRYSAADAHDWVTDFPRIHGEVPPLPARSWQAGADITGPRDRVTRSAVAAGVWG